MIRKLFQWYPNLQEILAGVLSCCVAGVIIVGGLTFHVQVQDAEAAAAIAIADYQGVLELKQELEEELTALLERFAFTPSLFSSLPGASGAGGAEIISEPTTNFSLSRELESEHLFRFPVAESDFVRYTSLHGERISPFLNVVRTHLGIDITTRVQRAQVVSAADGIVIEHWPPPGTRGANGLIFRGHPVYGGMLVIEHDNGWRTLYAHLSETFVDVRNKRVVKEGQVLGRIGNSGLSTGFHLHFEVQRPDGSSANPLLYIPDPLLLSQ